LVIQSQRQILKDVKNAMNTFFDENTHAANGIAQRLEKLEDRSQINEILSTTKLSVSPEIERIFVGYESDGAMYRSNGNTEMPKDNGYDPRTSDWYKIAKGSTATFSDPYKSSSSNAMMIAFSAPIGDKGVAAMNADISSLSEEIMSISKTDYSYAYVVDKDGKIIIHPDKNIINTAPELTKKIKE
ncbi:cache domain-containing protein, partial [Campylobacter concisus]|uniref:cache domain-containing protein n=1 Tax=Campylobacter concisus TaxID=199 RepID=UPI0015E15E33